MEQKYWWNKYYKRCHTTKDEYEEYGFKKGEPMQDGYEETFEDFIEPKAKYEEQLGDSGYCDLLLGQNGHIYYTAGARLYEVTERDIFEILDSISQEN